MVTRAFGEVVIPHQVPQRASPTVLNGILLATRSGRILKSSPRGEQRLTAGEAAGVADGARCDPCNLDLDIQKGSAKGHACGTEELALPSQETMWKSQTLKEGRRLQATRVQIRCGHRQPNEVSVRKYQDTGLPMFSCLP